MATVTTELLKRNAELKAKFFQDREIRKEYKIPILEKPFGYIYCIENLTNGKKYIGSTHATYKGVEDPSRLAMLYKRMNEYIYEYNGDLNKSSSVVETLRPIARAMVKEGIENFVFYPIAETTMKDHSAKERYFVELFNSIENGYNVAMIRGTGPISIDHPGRKQSLDERRKRSEPILAINLNEKLMVFVESMKLFGDYLGTSKDIIKNNARSGRNYKGWFIFYKDLNKRTEIFQKVMGDQLGIQSNGCSRNHSEKSKKFYKELYDSVNEFLKNPRHSEQFGDFVLMPDMTFESMEKGDK